MCWFGRTWYGHAIASFVDIVMASIGIFLYWKEHDDCKDVNSAYYVNVMGQIKIVVHVLDILLQWWVKLTKDQQFTDNEFNSKSLWAGILFTFIHVTKLCVAFGLLIPNLEEWRDAEGCRDMDIFCYIFLVFSFAVISFRDNLHYAHGQAVNLNNLFSFKLISYQ